MSNREPEIELALAQAAKYHAEVAEISARTARSAEQALLRDSLRLKGLELAVTKAEIELESQRRYARVAELELEHKERDETLLRADWRLKHIFHFIGAVDATTTGAAMDRINQWDSEDPTCDMTIMFNSPGGGVLNGMALFDYIRFMRNKGHRVTCVALGYAASMAGILLQAASDGCRVMARGSWLLIHEVAFSTSGKIGEVEDMYKFGERLKQQAADIFIERSGGKLTRAVLAENWTRKDWWLSPAEALALGIIDEVR